MSRQSRKRPSAASVQILLTGLLATTAVSSGVAVAAPANDSERQSSSIHLQGGRELPTRSSESSEAYGKLVLEGERKKADTRGGFAKPGTPSTMAQSLNQDFWIYDADVQLYNDDDADGFYHGIDLLFDADTIYAAADVYAVMYLSFEGGPWNEYAATEDFTIFGATSDDEYVLLTELTSGYPTGSYDILIELFDAFDGTFLASLGPDEAVTLGYLPLEDYNRDAPPDEVIIVTSHSGGGGSLDSTTIGFLALLGFVSLLRHRRLAAKSVVRAAVASERSRRGGRCA